MKGSTVLNEAKKHIGDTDGLFYNEQYYGKKCTKVNAWCCMFLWYVYKNVGASDLFYNGKKTASCTTLLNYYRKNHPEFVHTDLKRCAAGDLVFYNFDNDEGCEHVGCFSNALTDNTFNAVEGNTSIPDSKINGVGLKERNIKKVMAFVSLPYEPEIADPVEKDYIIYTIQRGDTLWKLSQRFYGFGIKWRRIYDYNNMTSTILKVGKTIKIPKGV